MKRIALILTSALMPAAFAADPFAGAAGTPLASYDPNYADARQSYVVDRLELVGDGSVRTDGGSSGGFSFANPAHQRDDGQTSQITLLGRNGGQVHDPYIRMLVQTLEGDNRYWGWQFSQISGGVYSRMSWYRGAPAISGATDIDISQHGLDPDAVRVQIDQQRRLPRDVPADPANRVTAHPGAGGEAQDARDNFAALNDGERVAVLEFLRTLRAPRENGPRGNPHNVRGAHSTGPGARDVSLQ